MKKEPTVILSEDAKRLKAIFEHSQDGIITIDSKGLIESLNPAAAALFGYEPSEVTGKNVRMLMPNPHQSNHDGYLKNYSKSGQKKIIGIGRAVEGLKKDGTKFPFYLSISEVKLDNRVIFTGFIHDISDIKNKEIELEENRKRLNAIFKTAVDAIIIIDDRGIMQMVNPAVTKLFLYEAPEMIGNNVKMLMPEPHKANHDQYLTKYHKTREKKIIGIGREVDGRKKDGTTFPIRLAVSEIQTAHGPIYVGMINDLTERKRIENELKKLNQSLEEKVSTRTAQLSDTVNKLLSSNKRLEFEFAEREKAQNALRKSEQELRDALKKEQQLNELKSRFVSMASHEFRTPLSTILSSVALIGRFTEPEHQPKREKHIDRIKSSVTNLTGILDDFLSISKLEEGKIEYNPTVFNFNDLCREVREEVEGLLKKDQKIFHESDKKEQTICVDRRLLKNVLFNLISNAVKYSPEGASIFCINSSKDGFFTIKIKDQGIGIPEQDQPHMFSRFFRAANVTNIQGTGLGLNIVAKYVEMMSGEIGFESKEGIGSTFWVTIPTKI